jgi:ubiquitin-like modifier-activating enzyme ATG7
VQDAAALEKLIDASDVVFLLTDSRESRWLPSTICAAKNKLIINAALGFDSWIVMRHGWCPFIKPEEQQDPSSTSPISPQKRLGCYFCNDVVAPTNSAVGRSLDEQCTVVRPALARIAAGMAVEMFAALTQHPSWIMSLPPAPDASVAPLGKTAGGPALGPVPHMLRGCLMGFSHTHMIGLANEHCSACSRPVVEEYLASGPQFVLRVIQVKLLLFLNLIAGVCSA